jgi:hypothetical protein
MVTDDQAFRHLDEALAAFVLERAEAGYRFRHRLIRRRCSPRRHRTDSLPCIGRRHSVSTASQAALALPMLCFRQVLFAGAVVPVSAMAAPGHVLSFGLANRFSFEALGRSLHLDTAAASFPSLRAYDGTFSGSVAQRWLVLSLFAVGLSLATGWVLRGRTRIGVTGRR